MLKQSGISASFSSPKLVPASSGWWSSQVVMGLSVRRASWLRVTTRGHEHTSSGLTVELVHTFPVELEFERNALWLLILTSRCLLKSLLSSGMLGVVLLRSAVRMGPLSITKLKPAAQPQRLPGTPLWGSIMPLLSENRRRRTWAQELRRLDLSHLLSLRALGRRRSLSASCCLP